MIPPTRRALVLCGPSGAGKTRLARRLHAEHGWPVVTLDDFYKDGDDVTLPPGPHGLPDWDHPRSWDADAALAAVRTLCRDGRVEVPTYDISASRATGRRPVEAGGAGVVVVEGIFAARCIEALRADGLLAAAWCVRHPRGVTFTRRLARDLAERRKPPVVLVRRGWHLMRAEPALVAEQRRLGAEPIRPARAQERARALPGAAGGVPPAGPGLRRPGP